MSAKRELLKMEHITMTFPGVIALDNVQFELCEGEVHALLGENGAGKSTLIKVLTGVNHKDFGTINYNGKEINPRTPQDAMNEGISTVYQEVNLCPNLSVAENIYIGREPKVRGHIDWKTINNNAKELVKKFELDIDVSKTLDSYSVAIQQMVAIARAVDVSAKILILDEPTSSLSNIEVQKLFEIMRMLKKQGLGIIFVTHFLDQVYEVSDRITVLRNGKYIGTYDTVSLPKVQLIGKMIGKVYEELNIDNMGLNELKEDGDVILELDKASTNQIDNISFQISKGEVLGLSGLLGSGRTEIVRMIFGADPLRSGTIYMNRKRLILQDTLNAIRNDIACCPENRKTEGIIGDLTIRENIILALQTKQGMFKKISKVEAEKLADKYIKELSIKTPNSEQLVKNLSGGNQQKVILARWLATKPQLLMLDEPTRGIDIGTKAEIQRIVINLAEEGMAIIFISSEIDEMLRCCNRMVVLRDKEKVGELRGHEINESNIMKSIAGGEEDEK